MSKSEPVPIDNQKHLIEERWVHLGVKTLAIAVKNQQGSVLNKEVAVGETVVSYAQW